MKKTIERDDLCTDSRSLAEKMKYLSELLCWLNQEYGTPQIEMIERKGKYDERRVKIVISDSLTKEE